MVTITSEAGEQLRAALGQEAEADSGLRLWVQAACGCGNVGYGMGLDDARASDSVYEVDGIRVLLDPASATLLGGATIDFMDAGLRGRGFVIHTADERRTTGGCGCGAG
jgi:iron-sulfur cluster assembly accessory protein